MNDILYFECDIRVFMDAIQGFDVYILEFVRYIQDSPVTDAKVPGTQTIAFV